jgi:hypothetical protein
MAQRIRRNSVYDELSVKKCEYLYLFLKDLH